MEIHITPTRSSIKLDHLLLERLALIQRGCLGVVACVAVVILSGWLVPSLGHILPSGWSQQKPNTALLALCSLTSLALSRTADSRGRNLAARLLAGFVALTALATLLEYILHRSFGLDSLLASRYWLQTEIVRMSPQTAVCFLLLSLVMLFLRVKQPLIADIVDLLLLSLCLLVLVVASGYIFGSIRLEGISVAIRVAPQTLVCMMLLAYVALLRRAEYGIFSILMGVGIGSRIARIACPFALVLPFLLEMARAFAVRYGWMNPPYATGLAASLAAMLGFGLIVILAWRIQALEKSIRDISLHDELTRVYNRRGFFALADQALRQAQRSKVPFTVLFIDLDNLKQINDTLGHETGSAFLAEVAGLLKKSFRKSDVIGRIGGDEFAVAGEASSTSIQLALQRLEQATAEWNTRPDRKYLLSFSYGYITSDVTREETLIELLGKADRAMYTTKRQKKLLRDSDPNQLIFREID